MSRETNIAKIGALRLASWSLGRVAEAVSGELIGGEPDAGIARVSTDTRDIDAGALFVALVGERFDAHDFVAQAFESDAAAAILHDEQTARDASGPVILVDDTLVALQRLGRAVWDEATEAGVRTVALTGSNGKTTVKEMTAAMLLEFGATFATPGNLNNHIGVPLTLCAMPADIDYLVLEMGANAVGDIDELIALAPAQTRMITSIGAAHLEGFGGMDGVRRGKSEIFRLAGPDEIAVVPASERDKLVLDAFEGPVITVGEGAGADIRLQAFEPRGGRPRASYLVEGAPLTVDLPIPGRHHAHNVGTAIGALLSLGLDATVEPIQRALDALELPGGRWREEHVGAITFIDDAYNANPTSTVASFDAFMQIEDERPRVAVIGEMLELGPTAESHHVEVAERIATSDGLAEFVAVGPYAAAMANAAATSVSAHAFDASDKAGRWLSERASREDGLLVFLKGSRGARLEDVIESTREQVGASAPPTEKSRSN